MENAFNRNNVKTIAWVLKSIGVNIFYKKTSFGDYYHVLTLLPVLLSTMSISLYIFNNRKDIDEAIIAAAYIGSTWIMFSSVIILFKNRGKILQILKIIDAQVYEYPDEKSIRVKINDTLKEENSNKVLYLIFAYECFGFSLSAISPIIGFLITGKYETSMFPSSYPWKEEGMFSSIVICILQLLGVISAFWIYNILQVIFTFITIEFLEQYRRLQEALLSLKSRTEDIIFVKNNVNCFRLKNNFRNVEFNDIYRKNIVHCMEHHRQLWRLFQLFKPWFSLFFSIELAISAATFALVFYNLLTKWSPEIFLTIIGSSFNVMANLFSRCVVGEIFIEMNIKIRDTIFYEITWWEQSTQNKNLLLLFHTMSKREYKLTGLSIFRASFLTFASLLRMSYSYFNIIHSTLDKT